MISKLLVSITIILIVVRTNMIMVTQEKTASNHKCSNNVVTGLQVSQPIGQCFPVNILCRQDLTAVCTLSVLFYFLSFQAPFVPHYLKPNLIQNVFHNLNSHCFVLVFQFSFII